MLLRAFSAVCVCVCVCVDDRERERERERVTKIKPFRPVIARNQNGGRAYRFEKSLKALTEIFLFPKRDSMADFYSG